MYTHPPSGWPSKETSRGKTSAARPGTDDDLFVQGRGTPSDVGEKTLKIDLC